MSIQQEIIGLIKQSQKILIMPSAPPDGDSIGSALALYLGLKKLNKEVTVVCPEAVPDTYHFLPSTHIIGDRVVASKDFVITIDTQKIKIENVKSIDEKDRMNIIITPANGRLSEDQVSFNYGPERYDLIITVDTGGTEQLGHLYSDHIDMFHQIPVINIDHHASNEHFGRLNFVDILAPSTTELLISVFEQLEKEMNTKLIDEDIATLLLAGIITDTGSFQNANTSPRAFDGSAKLVSYGARQQEIIQHIFKTKQLSTLKLWGRILTKMQTDEKYNIVWSVLTRKDFQDTMSSESETGGIIDELLTNAPGSEIVFLLKERKDGSITCSVRTTTPAADASLLAEKFGGGGHVQAAGFRMTSGNIEEIEQQILKVFREYQAQRLGIGVEEKTLPAAIPTPVTAPPAPAVVTQPKPKIVPAPQKTPAADVALPPPPPPPPKKPQSEAVLPPPPPPPKQSQPKKSATPAPDTVLPPPPPPPQKTPPPSKPVAADTVLPPPPPPSKSFTFNPDAKPESEPSAPESSYQFGQK